MSRLLRRVMNPALTMYHSGPCAAQSSFSHISQDNTSAAIQRSPRYSLDQ